MPDQNIVKWKSFGLEMVLHWRLDISSNNAIYTPVHCSFRYFSMPFSSFGGGFIMAHLLLDFISDHWSVTEAVYLYSPHMSVDRLMGSLRKKELASRPTTVACCLMRMYSSFSRNGSVWVRSQSGVRPWHLIGLPCRCHLNPFRTTVILAFSSGEKMK